MNLLFGYEKQLDILGSRDLQQSAEYCESIHIIYTSQHVIVVHIGAHHNPSCQQKRSLPKCNTVRVMAFDLPKFDHLWNRRFCGSRYRRASYCAISSDISRIDNKRGLSHSSSRAWLEPFERGDGFGMAKEVSRENPGIMIAY